MAADRPGTSLEQHDALLSPDHKGHIPKRHARVTVKYNRKELQRRLDVEKWIEDGLDLLYSGQEDDLPEELNIDDLIDLPDDEERVKKLQELFKECSSNTETFIRELVAKLDGVHKQEALQSEGVEHPAVGHSHGHRHEPYHFNDPHHHFQHSRGQNQTL
ncbi:protein phosphatase 1 regulatory subunit 14A-like [Brachionichthys hirsutus]|uniref:protein phosphatase 1 regulatory subunit 14A-like n=1 Tax=Brachionichthys hirsutus TaxID=412623 RepID=UPI00360479E5